jgi:spatacsin
LQGETGLAVATLERLGDDVESDLRQLMQGTVRRSLRLQIADEMKKRGYIRPNEWKMLETITLIEVDCTHALAHLFTNSDTSI